jgi:hypothetical protein
MGFVIFLATHPELSLFPSLPKDGVGLEGLEGFVVLSVESQYMVLKIV